jgi:hypothetical protein
MCVRSHALSEPPGSRHPARRTLCRS